MSARTWRLNRMVSILRECGHRITLQRLAVLGLLAQSEGYPREEEIFRLVAREFRTVRLTTVYKTVALLEELGKVLALAFSQGPKR